MRLLWLHPEALPDSICLLYTSQKCYEEERKLQYVAVPDEILARDKTSLDITWMKSDSGTDDYTLAEVLEQIKDVYKRQVLGFIKKRFAFCERSR